MLVIALCKGRFLEPSLETLARAGIRFGEDVISSRKLIFDSENPEKTTTKINKTIKKFILLFIYYQDLVQMLN